MQLGDWVRDEVKQAFVLVPERREAQILFEAAAFPLRPNKPEFRKFVRRFIDNDAVRNAARNKRPLPRYLVADTAKTFPSPAFWYAAILPEGEGEREQAFKNEAVTILRGIGGDEADLQRRVIEVSLSQNDPAALAQATANLEAAVNAPGDAANTFTFQVACDMLAQVRLNACAAQAVNVDACQTQACSLFRMILKIRQDQAQVGQLSTRPASKLSLFYLFLAQAGQGGNTDSDNFAKERLANAGFAEVFRRELFESNKAFHDQATWNAVYQLTERVTAPAPSVTPLHVATVGAVIAEPASAARASAPPESRVLPSASSPAAPAISVGRRVPPSRLPQSAPAPAVAPEVPTTRARTLDADGFAIVE